MTPTHSNQRRGLDVHVKDSASNIEFGIWLEIQLYEKQMSGYVNVSMILEELL